jgi:hypothetical protein
VAYEGRTFRKNCFAIHFSYWYWSRESAFTIQALTNNHCDSHIYLADNTSSEYKLNREL